MTNNSDILGVERVGIPKKTEFPHTFGEWFPPPFGNPLLPGAGRHNDRPRTPKTGRGDRRAYLLRRPAVRQEDERPVPPARDNGRPWKTAHRAGGGANRRGAGQYAP